MVEPNPWIDKALSNKKATAAQLTQSDRAVVGVVSGTHKSDPVSIPEGWVEVTIPDSTEPPVVVPSDGGITGLDASVLCKRDSSGRIVSAATPQSLPTGAKPVAVGVVGEWLASLDSAQAGLDGRMDQADADIAQNAHDIDHAKTEIADAKKVAEQAAQVAGNAQSAAVQATTDAQAAQTAADGAASKADQAAANLLALAGKTGRVIRSATAPTGDDRNANNLWLNTSNGQLSQWTGSSWQVITDSRLTDAANAADQAANLAGTAKSTADAAATKATQAQSAADAASSAAQTAQAAATAAQSTADAAQAQASSAASAAATAQGTANQAKSDAASAAGIAGGKADILIQNAEPATSMRKATTLWIDTTGGGNKPKRWSGSAWVVVTDKAATDAAAAAASAQGTADKAVTAAATAKALADAAQAAALAAQSTADAAASKASTADGRYTVATTNPTASDASGKPIGAVWEVRSGGTALRRYVLTAATTWTQVKAGQDFVGDKAIGQAQIGDLAVGTAQIANLAVTDAKIGTMSVGKLVAGSANVDNAVVQKLSVAIANVIQLGVDRLVAGTGTLNEATAKKLWANIATFGNVTITGDLLANVITGIILRGGLFEAGGGSLPMVRIGPLSGVIGSGDSYGVRLTTPSDNAKGSVTVGVSPAGPWVELAAPGMAYGGTDNRILLQIVDGTPSMTFMDSDNGAKLNARGVTGMGGNVGDVDWQQLINAADRDSYTRMTTPSTYAWKDGTVPLLMRRGSIVHCTSGGLYKLSGSFMFSDSWALFGAIIPAGFAPKNHVNHPAEVIQNDRPYIATLWISPDGSVRARTAINVNIDAGQTGQALIIPSMTWEAPANLPA